MIQNIKLSLIESNNGQIPGVPRNPRFLKDEKFERLVRSIFDFPEMLEYREVIVYPLNGKYIAICGNMRFRAIQYICRMTNQEFEDEIKERLNSDRFADLPQQYVMDWDNNIRSIRAGKTVPCKILSPETPEKKIRELLLKDNNSYGSNDHDILGNEYDIIELGDWDVDLLFLEDEVPEEEEKNKIESTVTVKLVFDIGTHAKLVEKIDAVGGSFEEIIISALLDE